MILRFYDYISQLTCNIRGLDSYTYILSQNNIIGTRTLHKKNKFELGHLMLN